MNEKELVIRGLECCTAKQPPEDSEFQEYWGDCDNCPAHAEYEEQGLCACEEFVDAAATIPVALIKRAIALLKEIDP